MLKILTVHWYIMRVWKWTKYVPIFVQRLEKMLRDELQKFGIPPNAEGLRQVLSFEVVDIKSLFTNYCHVLNWWMLLLPSRLIGNITIFSVMPSMQLLRQHLRSNEQSGFLLPHLMTSRLWNLKEAQSYGRLRWTPISCLNLLLMIWNNF